MLSSVSVKSRAMVAGYARIGNSLSVLLHFLLYLCVPGVVVRMPPVTLHTAFHSKLYWMLFEQYHLRLGHKVLAKGKETIVP